MLRIFTVVSIIAIGQTNAKQCDWKVYRALGRCENTVGYTANTFNISTLVQHCRNPNRQSLIDCFRQAYGSCDPGWSPRERPVFQEGIAWASKTLDYLCGRVSVIEDNIACIRSVSPGILECIRNSTRGINDDLNQLYNETPLQSIQWEVKKGILERYSRSKEVCVFDLVNSGCNDVIGKVFGNFFYGYSVYVYDEANKMK